MEIKKRHDMKSSQIKTLRKRVNEELGEEFSSLLKGSRYEICTTDTDIVLILVDGKPVFLEKKIVFPTLKVFLDIDCRKLKRHVTVDMGAVPFVTNGADVMRPGIIDIDNSIEKGDFVVITEERHGKPLAIGEALFSAREIQTMDQGKVVLNVHYVGDKMWSLEI
ncbi:MAG: RNA-binding protein [Theionarchaea archaeon]|nr:RNA-binding protein [Theionarchaea archaeon]